MCTFAGEKDHLALNAGRGGGAPQDPREKAVRISPIKAPNDLPPPPPPAAFLSCKGLLANLPPGILAGILVAFFSGDAGRLPGGLFACFGCLKRARGPATSLHNELRGTNKNNRFRSEQTHFGDFFPTAPKPVYVPGFTTLQKFWRKGGSSGSLKEYVGPAGEAKGARGPSSPVLLARRFWGS